MAPIFMGIGYGSITGVICLVTYYRSLIAITVYFFIATFAKTVPWAVCHQEMHEDVICNGSNLGLYMSELYIMSKFLKLFDCILFSETLQKNKCQK